jgi:hypothetical protein
MADDALGGVGGLAGMKNDGRQAALDWNRQVSFGGETLVKSRADVIRTIMAIYRTMLGTSPGSRTKNESTSWPSAAPSGLANVANAVALVRPLAENQRSLYLVGDANTKGCARPSSNWPNMTTPKWPPLALVPAYRTQLPTRIRPEATMMTFLGPPLLRM